jgi:drug/metabolite transporter (DMT)-like permease
MSIESNVTARRTITQDRVQQAAAATRGPAARARRSLAVRRSALPPGLLLGALGVLAFSFSLPATRLAVADLDPWLVAFGRAVVAGLFSVAVLATTRAPRPTAKQWRSLTIVAIGVVVGFPLFTSLALHHLPASHGAVVVGMLPAATAVAAVLRAGERPTRAFWLASTAGLAAVLAFALTRGGGDVGAPDLELLAAIVLCALGYAEGGRLSRELGGARTICWALVLSLPVTLTVATIALTQDGAHAGATAWLGFAYVSVISMFLGFFAWYAGLARGGVAKIGQVQLAQPVLSLIWAALILGESVGPATVLAALVVLACVVATQRAEPVAPVGAHAQTSGRSRTRVGSRRA